MTGTGRDELVIQRRSKVKTMVTRQREHRRNYLDTVPLKAFSAALVLSSILLSAPQPAVADISGLTPCKESKQFAKRQSLSIKKLESSLKLYAPDSAPVLAVKATVEKTKRRFYDYEARAPLRIRRAAALDREWRPEALGEFITPGILFLYISRWIGWVGRSYLIAIRNDKKPTQKEIIIDGAVSLLGF